MGTILVGRVRFWKGLVSFKSARGMMVTDGRTELVTDKTVTRDAYASKNEGKKDVKLNILVLKYQNIYNHTRGI